MKLPVTIKKTGCLIKNSDYKITMCAFLKHMGIAGMHYAPTFLKYSRCFGMFLHYSSYLKKDDLDKNRFSLPPDNISDPTEKGDFSTLVGKAIADFLAKRIDESRFTVTYEAAMRLENLKIDSELRWLELRGHKILLS